MEDDPDLARTLQAAAERFFPSLRLVYASTYAEASRLLATVIAARTPFVILADHDLGDANTGLDLLKHARDQAPHAHRILMSARLPTEATEVPHQFLEKPFALSQFQAAVERGARA